VQDNKYKPSDEWFRQQELQGFIDKLNNLSVPTRYPDELSRLLKDYKQDVTKAVLSNSKELLSCLKQKL
jgi:HEPN domain-containing protein